MNVEDDARPTLKETTIKVAGTKAEETKAETTKEGIATDPRVPQTKAELDRKLLASSAKVLITDETAPNG